MSDTKETSVAEPSATGHVQELSPEEPVGTVVLPEGWMYRQRKIGPLRLSWYASPRVQLLMVSFVCFLCPGMFNALSGLGGAGKTNKTLGDHMVSPSIGSLCLLWGKP
jgi:hypothetical protein